MPSTLELLLRKNTDETILNNVPSDILCKLYTEETGKTGTDTAAILAELRGKYPRDVEPLIGIHQSFTGLRNLWSTAAYYGNNTFQCFLRNNRNMKRREITYDDIACFNVCAKRVFNPCFVTHAPYALNPASGESTKRRNAVSIIREDVELVQKLFGDGYYVLHPGAWTEYSKPLSSGMLILSMHELEDLKAGIICLETMAGQGTQHLRDIESMQIILDKCPHVNLCVDTCHIWAAGIGFNEFIQFAETYANRIKVIHVNDSLTDFGSHADRHANIDYGRMDSSELYKFLLRMHKLCPGAPMILETPADHIDESLAKVKELFKVTFEP